MADLIWILSVQLDVLSISDGFWTCALSNILTKDWHEIWEELPLEYRRDRRIVVCI